MRKASCNKRGADNKYDIPVSEVYKKEQAN
jgi:hypothetical protein